MNKQFCKSMAVSSLLAASFVWSQEPGEHISFLACPVMRDTETVPCWLAEHEGEMYFLGIQTDSGGWPAPYLKHKVLVEGSVSDMPRICGGIVLESSGTPFDRRPSGTAHGRDLPNPPVTSNMRELDLSCNTILPANGQHNDFEPRRGPGPNVYRAPISAEELAAAREEEEAERLANLPTPPYEERSFMLHYEFDSELAALTIGNATEALEYARYIEASAINIDSYRASSLLSNGNRLTELASMPERRANEIANTLQKLGLPNGTELTVNWHEDTIEGDGIDDWQGRRTEITVIP